MPTSMKVAMLMVPLLKQSSLDTELFSNDILISNLKFATKLCEKVVAVQVTKYLKM